MTGDGFILSAPSEYTILYDPENSQNASTLTGQLQRQFACRPSTSCHFQLFLIRVANIEYARHLDHGTALKRHMKFPRSERCSVWSNMEAAERIACESTHVNTVESVGKAYTAHWKFELQIPSWLPPSIHLPSAEVSYALVATCSTSGGNITQTSQILKIWRQLSKLMILQPTAKLSFPDPPLNVRISFGQLDQGSRIRIPTTLQLAGLQMESTRSSELRWRALREIKWKIEEIAMFISGPADETGRMPLISASRSEKRREISQGKQKVKPKYPAISPERRQSVGINDVQVEELFYICATEAAGLKNNTDLSTEGGFVLHAVHNTTILPCSASTIPPQDCCAIHLEYRLHLRLYFGEDTIDLVSGSLVDRKRIRFAHTMICPLIPARETQDVEDVGLLPTIPPAYMSESVDPPGYTLQ